MTWDSGYDTPYDLDMFAPREARVYGYVQKGSETLAVLLPGSTIMRRDAMRAQKAVRRRRQWASRLYWIRARCPRLGGWR